MQNDMKKTSAYCSVQYLQINGLRTNVIQINRKILKVAIIYLRTINIEPKKSKTVALNYLF
jgi:hypothetical protein